MWRLSLGQSCECSIIRRTPGHSVRSVFTSSNLQHIWADRGWTSQAEAIRQCTRCQSEAFPGKMILLIKPLTLCSCVIIVLIRLACLMYRHRFNQHHRLRLVRSSRVFRFCEPFLYKSAPWFCFQTLRQMLTLQFCLNETTYFPYHLI